MMIEPPQLACAGCGQVVTSDTGYITLNDKDLRRAEGEIRKWESEHGSQTSVTLRELLSRPREAEWKIWHRNCDPDPTDGGYWFNVARCDTWEKVLAWTLHLSDKGWFEYTGWHVFVRSQLGFAGDA